MDKWEEKANNEKYLIERIEVLRQALIIHDSLYDVLLKIKNPKSEDLREYMRESMLCIDSELTRLVKTVKGDEQIDMHKKLMAKF